MRRIALQQIQELPEDEQRQMKAYCNHWLGSLRKKRKRIAAEQMKAELGVENDQR